jgi:hypothetical protein
LGNQVLRQARQRLAVLLLGEPLQLPWTVGWQMAV